MRWKIEVFHKILKSGCRAEDAKLRTADRLANLVALFCIVSWRVLWMTMMARTAPEADPAIALTATEIAILDRLIGDSGNRRAKPGTLQLYLTKLSRLGGYDFGDDWRHSIVIEEVLPADPATDYPRFVDGARRAPPEDVGGLPGFEEFLDAMAKPRHPAHKSVLQRYERPFDPEDISPDVIHARMATLAKRRASGKAAHAINKA